MQIRPVADGTNRPLPLLTITELHRNVGKVFDQLSKVGGYAVVRDSKVIGKILPAANTQVLTREQRIAKVKALAGGFHLGKGRTPRELNQLLDQRYDEVLPR